MTRAAFYSHSPLKRARDTKRAILEAAMREMFPFHVVDVELVPVPDQPIGPVVEVTLEPKTKKAK